MRQIWLSILLVNFQFNLSFRKIVLLAAFHIYMCHVDVGILCILCIYAYYGYIGPEVNHASTG